ncbi:Uncharacterised protein [Mycobacteroides abscessus]|nr:Uncharacterised protein [Mycobacteroides abscessus]
MSAVPMLLTEEAVRLLVVMRADFQTFPTTPPRGRIFSVGGGPLGVYDADQVRAQSEYLRIVSIVEAYIDACSDELLRAGSLGLGELVDKLVAEASERASDSWDRRKTAFRDYHGVNMGTCDGWEVIDQAIQVRNAIAHGLGRLTLRQRNQRSIQKIAKSGVLLSGDRVRIPRGAIERNYDASIRFVKSVDRAIRAR